ncbi:MAG: dynamin family protein [Vibrionaceae bacterium]
MSNKHLFLNALKKFESDFKYIYDKEQDLVAIKSALVQELTQAGQFKQLQLSEAHPLFKLAQQIKLSVKHAAALWDAKLEEASPMRALSEQFADRVILLVFGKVNAGKSSFCNYLTDLFAPDEIKRFRFENGQVKYFDGAFAEGVTETTAQIQGVELGSNLVLLDSPGLHSVAYENGELTRRYTDSADAILWLTPSSSPGQVQELHDLKLELEKKKPLQPIITKSDVLIEDYCEDTQRFIQKVKNKLFDVRQLQEADVHSRVIALGNVDNLKEAVSVSVHAYKALELTSTSALQDAGLHRLFERLVAIVDEANRYKVIKAQQQMVNFLDAQVVHSLNEDIMPQIQELQQLLQATSVHLQQKQQALTQHIIDNVLCELPQIIGKHIAQRDKKAISLELNQFIEKQISITLQEELSGYVGGIQSVAATLSDDNLGNFCDITIDVKEITEREEIGKTAKATGAGGALLGMLIAGPLGGLMGGLLGTAAGSKTFTDVTVRQETVGVSSEQMLATTSKAIRQQLPQLIGQVFGGVETAFAPLQQYTHSLFSAIEGCAAKVQALKG